jgi:curved DNA-binding protein CbpA
MITHYEVLEVPEQASATDIRQAYRRLVLLTHPDRTPDPTAHQRYLAVNRAYEILSAPAKRQFYDAQLWALRNPRPVPAIPATIPPVAVPRPVRRRSVSLQERYAAEYARLLRWMRPVMLLSMVLCLLLLLDYGLTRERVERILSYSVDVYYEGGSSRSRGTPHIYFRHQTEQGRFDSDERILLGEKVRVRRTLLMRKALQVVRSNGQHVQPSNLYTDSWLAPWILFVCAGLAQSPRFNSDVRLGVGLLGVLLLIITGYLLISA